MVAEQETAAVDVTWGSVPTNLPPEVIALQLGKLTSSTPSTGGDHMKAASSAFGNCREAYKTLIIGLQANLYKVLAVWDSSAIPDLRSKIEQLITYLQHTITALETAEHNTTQQSTAFDNAFGKLKDHQAVSLARNAMLDPNKHGKAFVQANPELYYLLIFGSPQMIAMQAKLYYEKYTKTNQGAYGDYKNNSATNTQFPLLGIVPPIVPDDKPNGGGTTPGAGAGAGIPEMAAGAGALGLGAVGSLTSLGSSLGRGGGTGAGAALTSDDVSDSSDNTPGAPEVSPTLVGKPSAGAVTVGKFRVDDEEDLPGPTTGFRFPGNWDAAEAGTGGASASSNPRASAAGAPGMMAAPMSGMGHDTSSKNRKFDDQMIPIFSLRDHYQTVSDASWDKGVGQYVESTKKQVGDEGMDRIRNTLL
ncbi:hypothetical protein [Mycobacterium sp.]|uniref:hypothetical protein n=1 Tax=Mycobacterium sp. TaxID=1785 RepID=UPI003BABC51C